MKKEILSEISLYHGDVSMPEGFEIDRDTFQNNILEAQIYGKEFQFSKPVEMLNTYLREHINLEYGFTLINKKIWGNGYKPDTHSPPILNVDPVDLKNSADYTLLYGVQVNDCMVRIHYDDNRRKGRSWDISLANNKFIMFPSTLMYFISNSQKESLNFIATITYDFA